jgi:hypothetical protein
MIDKNTLKLVLEHIALSHGIDPDCMSVGDNDGIFYRKGNALVCLCQRGSSYWNEIEAGVIMAQLMKRAAHK